MPSDETAAARGAGLVQVLVFWLGYIVVLVLAAFATGLVGVTGATRDMTYGALVGSTSYLATFALLTLAFWLVHRRRIA